MPKKDPPDTTIDTTLLDRLAKLNTHDSPIDELAKITTDVLRGADPNTFNNARVSPEAVKGLVKVLSKPKGLSMIGFMLGYSLALLANTIRQDQGEALMVGLQKGLFSGSS